MTDTINKARALLAHWRVIGWFGWSDDGSAPAYTTVAALIADLEAARAELAERDVVDRRVYLSAVETVGRVASERDDARADLEAARAELARVTAERDNLLDAAPDGAWMARALDAEREFAAARAAMPTSVEWLALTGIYAAAVEHVTGGGEHRPTPTADRELDDVRGWFNRRTAYHAAHPAASTPDTTTIGGDDA